MLAGLRSSERALIFATHDLDLALRHAHRILWLEEGALRFEGPPDALMELLSDDGALRLPPLARLCRERGLRFDTPAALAALPEDAR